MSSSSAAAKALAASSCSAAASRSTPLRAASVPPAAHPPRRSTAAAHPLPSRTTNSRHQPQLGVDGFDVAHLPTPTIRYSARKSPVDVWRMIGFMPAVGALVRCIDGSWMTRPPQRCPAGHRLEPGPDARRAPAVQHVSRRAHDLDVPGVRWRGVWATANRQVPDSRWCRSGALSPHGASTAAFVV